MSLSLGFKLSAASGGKTFDLTDLEASLTVLDLKGKLEAHSELKPDACRLIYKGKILKDPDTLESIGVKSGEQVHIVKSAAKTAEAPAAAAPAADGAAAVGMSAEVQARMNDPAAIQRAMDAMMGGGAAPAPVDTGVAFPSMPQAQQQPNPLAAMMSQQGAGGGMPNMSNLDPAMMQQMMSNPAMQGVMQQMLSNPAMLQQMFQGNPMIAQMMNDPAMAGLMENVEGMMDDMAPEELEDILNNPGLDNVVNQMQRPQAGEEGSTVPAELTEADNAAVDRLMALGFDKAQATQAYIAAGKNEELAANFLFD